MQGSLPMYDPEGALICTVLVAKRKSKEAQGVMARAAVTARATADLLALAMAGLWTCAYAPSTDASRRTGENGGCALDFCCLRFPASAYCPA